jgi:hypothetical protein
VRSDIRSSFAGLSGAADGVQLALVLTIVSASTCAPLAGRAVYLWHCDRPGRYSLYSSGVTNQNYLRGVQEADANGVVTFTSIFPGCYSGRWPHIHFEVYPSLSAATSVGNKIATSQIALPKTACDEVYDIAGYEGSVTNLSRVTLASDNVFSDGSALELATGDRKCGGGDDGGVDRRGVALLDRERPSDFPGRGHHRIRRSGAFPGFKSSDLELRRLCASEPAGESVDRSDHTHFFSERRREPLRKRQEASLVVNAEQVSGALRKSRCIGSAPSCDDQVPLTRIKRKRVVAVHRDRNPVDDRGPMDRRNGELVGRHGQG